jgi:hypothetical protein
MDSSLDGTVYEVLYAPPGSGGHPFKSRIFIISFLETHQGDYTAKEEAKSTLFGTGSSELCLVTLEPLMCIRFDCRAGLGTINALPSRKESTSESPGTRWAQHHRLSFYAKHIRDEKPVAKEAEELQPATGASAGNTAPGHL